MENLMLVMDTGSKTTISAASKAEGTSKNYLFLIITQIDLKLRPISEQIACLLVSSSKCAQYALRFHVSYEHIWGEKY